MIQVPVAGPGHLKANRPDRKSGGIEEVARANATTLEPTDPTRGP